MASSTILSDNGASSGSAGLKTSGGNDGKLILQTATSGGTATDAVTIDTSQNVGIGTSSPANKLDVQGSGNVYSRVYSTSTNNAGLRLGNSATDWYLIGAGQALQFYDGIAGAERMRIDSSGNLLVGTTNTNGSISNSAIVLNGGLRTARGTFVQSGGSAWYDAFTLTQEGLYIVHAFIGGYNAGPSDWSNAWMISYTGANNPYVATAMGAVGNIQCRTKTGATTTIQIFAGAGAGVTFTWVVQRIN